MTANAPIAIIGAGISGLALARSLLRRGIPSTIYEKSPSPSPASSTGTDTSSSRSRHNYGLTLSADSCSLLSAELSPVSPNFLSQISISHPSTNGPHASPQTSVAPFRIDRARLESLLATGLDIKWQHELYAVDLPGTATSPTQLHFHNDTVTGTYPYTPSTPVTITTNASASVSATLVVAADGVHSTLRSLLLPRLCPHVLPYVVFRGQRQYVVTPSSSSSSMGILKRRTFAHLMRNDGVMEMRARDGTVRMWVGVDEWPKDGLVDGRAGKGGAVSWFYSRRARTRTRTDREEDVLYRPDRKTHEAGFVPREFWAEVRGVRDEVLDVLDADSDVANAEWGEGLETDEKEEVFKWVFDIERMEKEDRVQNFLMRRIALDSAEGEEGLNELAHCGIVFVGDAVHAMPIVGGEGADCALRDAVELAGGIEEWWVGGDGDGEGGGRALNGEEKASGDADIARERLGAAILKFYDTRLEGGEEGYSWKTMGDNAELALANMHNI